MKINKSPVRIAALIVGFCVGNVHAAEIVVFNKNISEGECNIGLYKDVIPSQGQRLRMQLEAFFRHPDERKDIKIGEVYLPTKAGNYTAAALICGRNAVQCLDSKARDMRNFKVSDNMPQVRFNVFKSESRQGYSIYFCEMNLADVASVP